MTSIVVIASSTKRPKAMIKAPSEIRCRSIPAISMIGNTITSVSGIERATTVPARMPRLRKLTAMMIAMPARATS
jgi:hypothetical protein